MLLLSRGLVLSFRDLLDRAGFDVRVLRRMPPPFTGPLIAEADAVAAAIAALPEVEAVVPVSIRDAEIVSDVAANPTDAGVDAKRSDARPPRAASVLGASQFIGADPARPADVDAPRGPRPARRPGRRRRAAPRESHRRRAGCAVRGVGDLAARHVRRRIRRCRRRPSRCLGIAEFPFDDATAETVAGRLSDLGRLCGEEQDAGRGHAAGQIQSSRRRRQPRPPRSRPPVPACTS